MDVRKYLKAVDIYLFNFILLVFEMKMPSFGCSYLFSVLLTFPSFYTFPMGNAHTFFFHISYWKRTPSLFTFSIGNTHLLFSHFLQETLIKWINQIRGRQIMLYSKTCLSRPLLGLKNLFSLDRCLVYTGSNYIDIQQMGL